MSKILEKYEELKNLSPLDVPQPKITDSYKSKDATPYTKGERDRQAADDESGIVTLEDVIEEIVGEINDEFDDDDLVYSKLDNNNFVFEGKAALNDVARILEIDRVDFEESKGESDSLAGLIIEVERRIPTKNEKIVFKNLTFTIE